MMRNYKILKMLAIGWLVFFVAGAAEAADKQNVDFEIYSGDDLTFEKSLDIIPDDFGGSARIALVNGKNEKNIAVSFGNQEKPEVRVIDNDGNLISRFNPFAAGFTGEIALCSADLDHDGSDEIIVGAGAGGGPQVRIFDINGNLKKDSDFWAYDENYRKGIEVAAGDINGDGYKEIIVSLIHGDNQGLLRFFDRFGKQVSDEVVFDMKNVFEPAKVGALDLGSDGIEEIFLAAGAGNEPKMKIIRKDGSVINEFLVYNENFLGGVNFTVLKENNENLIITGAGFSGDSHIRFFDTFGRTKKDSKFFSYEKGIRGGVNVAYGDIDGDEKSELIAVPQQLTNDNEKLLYKYIDIDISEQKLSYYEKGRLIDEFAVSTGTWTMPTPFGVFAIWQKSPLAYSAKYSLFMPWWMSFKPGYGIHELPEWADGTKEGANHLGMRVSHGCVRLGIGAAKKLYDWAPMGTLVFIHE